MSTKAKALFILVAYDLACLVFTLAVDHHKRSGWAVAVIVVLGVLCLAYYVYLYRKIAHTDKVVTEMNGPYDNNIDPADLKAWRRQHPNLSLEAAIEVYLNEQEAARDKRPA